MILAQVEQEELGDYEQSGAARGSAPGAISRCRCAEAREIARTFWVAAARGADRPGTRLRPVRYRRSPEGPLALQAQTSLNASAAARAKSLRRGVGAAGTLARPVHPHR